MTPVSTHGAHGASRVHGEPAEGLDRGGEGSGRGGPIAGRSANTTSSSPRVRAAYAVSSRFSNSYIVRWPNAR